MGNLLKMLKIENCKIIGKILIRKLRFHVAYFLSKQLKSIFFKVIFFKLNFNNLNSKKFFLILLLFFINNKVFSQNIKEIIDQQDLLIRNQQNNYQENSQNEQFEQIKKHNNIEQDNYKSNDDQLYDDDLKKCILLNQIKLKNAYSLSNKFKKTLKNSFANKCLNAKTITEIIKIISNHYHDIGMVTTQIKIPKQNIKNGNFELQIIEGRIEKIILGKNRFIEKMQIIGAFGNNSGEILDVNDINQGIFQMNRLSSNNAIAKIEPGSFEGGSIIKIENNRKLPFRFNVGQDNLGTNFTGIKRSIFGLGYDNLLFLNDNININYSTNLHDKNKIKNNSNLTTTFSIPHRYNTLSFTYTTADFNSLINYDNEAIKYEGFLRSKKIAIDRVIFNNNKFKSSINLAITKKSSASSINNIKISESERNLSIFNLDFNLWYFDNIKTWYLSPSFVKGLTILDAKKDRDDAIKTEPRSQFKTYKINSNFSYKLIIPKIQLPMILTSELSGQYSKDTLYGSEQFSAGGYYSVRGYRENFINGDSGYLFRNKVNLNFYKSLKAIYNFDNFQKKININLSFLNNFSFEPFFDYGFVRNNYIDNKSSGRLSGFGIKSILNHKYLNCSLTYSKGLGRSNMIISPLKENELIYFEISIMPF